jgi:hypothetical protein
MESPTCTGCKVTAPETKTVHTLISASHGWRLTRVRSAEGDVGLAWFCASCWKRRRDGAGAPVAKTAVTVRTSRPSPESGRQTAVEAGRTFDRVHEALSRLPGRQSR